MPAAPRANTGPRQSPRLLFSVTARPALNVIVGHIDHLHRAGWDVHVIVGEPTDPRLVPHAHLQVVPMDRGRAGRADLRSYRAIKKAIACTRPTVVVGATPKAAALTLRAARKLGVPHRVWWAWGFRHESEGSRLSRWGELSAARSATDVVAASDSLAGVLAGHKVQAQVIGAGSVAGVDLDTFMPAKVRGRSEPTVAVIGRLSRTKGLDHLVRMWPQVLRRIPRARLLLAGEADPLDPAAAEVDALSRMPGVEVLGFVEDVPALLQQADVLALPSRREGLPAVVLEAAASEVPAVVWDVTGSRDAVVDRQTGRVIAYGDESEFVAQVCALLEDSGARRAMGAAARRRAGMLFDRHRVEGSFAAFLDRVTPEARADPHPAETDTRTLPEQTAVTVDLSDRPASVPLSQHR